jgi:undecaprenyl-diphosphatase
MSFLSFFGSSYFFLPAYALMVIYFLWKNRKRYALDIAIVGTSSFLLMFGLKNLFRRNRPDEQLLEKLHNYSFPSGHAVSSFIFCCVLSYIIWNSHMKQTWKWIICISLLLFCLMIGISRIVLRFHYASDVVAGLCLGVIWGLFCLWLLYKIPHKQKSTK